MHRNVKGAGLLRQRVDRCGQGIGVGDVRHRTDGGQSFRAERPGHVRRGPPDQAEGSSVGGEPPGDRRTQARARTDHQHRIRTGIDHAATI